MNVIGGYVLTKNDVLSWEIGVLVLASKDLADG